MSSTQQLILLTLFIIRPVSSDQTDFTSAEILTRCLKGTSFIHEVIVQNHVPGVKSKTDLQKLRAGYYVNPAKKRCKVQFWGSRFNVNVCEVLSFY